MLMVKSNRIEDLKQKLNKFLKIAKIKSSWIDLMVSLRALNINNDSFGLNYIELTEYGFSAVIKIPIGMTFDDFINLKDPIETAYQARLVINDMVEITSDITNKGLIQVEFMQYIDFTKRYTGIKLDNITDVVTGLEYSGKPIILDFSKLPHALLCGLTRQGKTKTMQLMLLALSQNFSIEEVEFWIYQVDKADMAIFEDNKNTKVFIERDYDAILESLILLKKEADRRVDIMRPYIKKGIIDNFLDYNNIMPKEKRMPAIYLAVDEIASIAQKGDASTKKVREDIDFYINYVVGRGASSGIYFITSVQRPDIESLKSSTKSQCSNRISFKAANDKSSEVCTDDNKLATELIQREFVYKSGARWRYGIVPFIDKKDIINLQK